ncbi:D(2) dopamine receptor-like [Haliotis rubra]|uniref:D(2) dopamine receptor-like n=1 Tax=Haliotis rubra TaxID=36100 RepID=UPI001EE5352C|nr:D(2) dopamine receptor-like [Haliotis rubra]
MQVVIDVQRRRTVFPSVILMFQQSLHMMENPRFQNDLKTFLRDYDDRHALQVLPAILCLAVLMLLGFLGNSLVCYVYIVKFKPSPTNRYIIALAIFDLINCGICIPHEIADMRYRYTLARYGLCKVMRVIMAFVSYASGSILLAIAVDRYRKICPFQRQATWLDAKVTIAVCSVMSLIVALPAAIIYGVKTVTTNNIHINGSDCSISDDYRGTPFPSIYNGAQFFIFVAATLCLLVLYSLIWRQVARRRTFFNKNRTRQNPEQQLHKSIVSFTVQSHAPENTCAASESSPPTDEHLRQGESETDEGMCSSKSTSTALDPSEDVHVASTLSTHSSSGNNKRSHKTLFMLFLITLVFVLSFLPYLCLMASQTASKETFAGIQGTGTVLYSLFLRSYFINSVSNPIIYGFCNLYFRREVRLLWRKVTCDATGAVTEGSSR